MARLCERYFSVAGCSSGRWNVFRPTYKRLVDKMFRDVSIQVDDATGVQRARKRMAKVIYYALSHPEKVDALGQYLCAVAKKFIEGGQTEYRVVACEIINRILNECQPASNSLFLQCVSRLVEQLRECQTEPSMPDFMFEDKRSSTTEGQLNREDSELVEVELYTIDLTKESDENSSSDAVSSCRVDVETYLNMALQMTILDCLNNRSPSQGMEIRRRIEDLVSQL